MQAGDDNYLLRLDKEAFKVLNSHLTNRQVWHLAWAVAIRPGCSREAGGEQAQQGYEPCAGRSSKGGDGRTLVLRDSTIAKAGGSGRTVSLRANDSV